MSSNHEWWQRSLDSLSRSLRSKKQPRTSEKLQRNFLVHRIAFEEDLKKLTEKRKAFCEWFQNELREFKERFEKDVKERREKGRYFIL